MEDKRNDRPLSYPRPTETDNQLQNQPEYIDQQPNDFRDKTISDIPLDNPDIDQVNNPTKEEEE